MPTALILTGPGAAGKTTIGKMLEARYGYTYLDGDKEDSEFFPDGDQWLPENSVKLRKAHQKILKKALKIFSEGKNVVIDYIIFGHYLEFIELFKKQFGVNLQIKVLLPSKNELVKRDKERECWTTGADRIAAVSQELISIRDKICPAPFIDTTGQTPEETFIKYFSDNAPLTL